MITFVPNFSFSHSFTGSYTMDAIARVAFGLNVDSQKEKNNKFVTTINTIFDNVNDTTSPTLLIFCEYYNLFSVFFALFLHVEVNRSDFIIIC